MVVGWEFPSDIDPLRPGWYDSLAFAPAQGSVGAGRREIKRPVVFADGRRGTCEVGRAEFVVDGRQTPALVIFGEETVLPVLGAMTLEGLGLGVDPLGRRLVPIEIPLA